MKRNGAGVFAVAVAFAACVLPMQAFAGEAAGSTPEVIAPGELPQISALQGVATPVRASAKDAPAPMPDADAGAPLATGNEDPHLAPAIYSTKTEFRGDGFSYGSSPQAVQEGATKPAAGVALDVPLN